MPDRLGRFTNEGYKIWEWRWDQDQSQLLHYKDGKMDVYEHSNLPQMVDTPNRWTRTRINQSSEERGMVCSVRETGLAVVAISYSAEPPREKLLPTEIRDVIKEWGCMWMWRSLKILGNDSWLRKAIEGRTLIAVTDGSYMREMYPQVCSAAFILECSKGSGRIVGSFAEASMRANAYR